MKVQAAYQSETGEPYTSTFDIDLDSIGEIAPAPTTGSKQDGSGRELANIDKAIRNLAVHVGELRLKVTARISRVRE